MALVFVDSDGVLAAFSQGFRDRFGVSARELPPEQVTAMVQSVPDFYSTLEVLPGAELLMDFLRPYNPTVLTGCPRGDFENADNHKRLWFRRHFPGVPVITCLAKDKRTHLAERGDFLIDDFIANVKRWVKVGGIGILHKTAERTIAEFTEHLNRKPEPTFFEMARQAAG